MKLPVLALALGLCAPAASAATSSYEFELEYLGTAFGDVWIEDAGYSSWLAPEADLWGIPGPIPGLSPGDHLSFSAVLSRPAWADDDDLGSGEGNGGVALSCQIGAFDCSDVNYVLAPEASWLQFGRDDDIDMTAELWPGGLFTYFIYTWGTEFSAEGGAQGSYQMAEAQFRILPAPAPVPLPAAGLMLPGALLGLAALRRRKR